MINYKGNTLLVKTIKPFSIENDALLEILYKHYESICSLRNLKSLEYEDFMISNFRMLCSFFPLKNGNSDFAISFFLYEKDKLGSLVSEYVNDKDCPMDAALEIFKKMEEILYLDPSDFDSLIIDRSNIKKEFLESTLANMKSWITN